MKTNGFRASHRNRWLLVKEGVLTISEMVLLDFYIDKMNFSPTSEDVGTIYLDYAELDLYLGKKESSISALNKSLIDKGFIKKIDPHKFEVTNWKRYIIGKFDGSDGMAAYFQKKEYNQPVEVLVQNLGINFQNIGKQPTDSAVDSTPSNPLIIKRLSKNVNNTNTQENVVEEKKTTDVATEVEVIDDFIGKDKRQKNIAGRFPKWVLIKQEPRTDKEYQKIQDEQADDMKMPLEDMKWIDQNAYGFEKIEDKDKEKWVIDIYFGGDLARYEKYLNPTLTRV